MSEQLAAGAQFEGDDESDRGGSLASVIERHVRAAFAEGMHVAIPATVAKVYTDGSGNVLKVDCSPGVHDFHRDETGQLIVASLPIVNSVPIGIPGGGGVRLTLPIAVGDIGHLAWFDRSIDRWLSGKGGAVDPEFYSRWNLTDALFTPGLRPYGAPWQSWPSDHATLGTDGPDDGSHVKIHFHAGVICIGDESGSQPIPLGTTLEQRVAKLEKAWKLHTHTVTGTCPAGGGPLTAGLTLVPTNVSSVDGTPTFQAAIGKVK